MKRLIVCADGTFGTPLKANVTNVVKVRDAVAATDAAGVEQKVFYDRGVGADATFLKRGLQGALGYGLEQNVKDCYRFLMYNYIPHENAGVLFFGYSRGAFTVRSLAGFIRKSGLLKLEHADKVDEAWKLYRKSKVWPGDTEAVRFRRDNSRRLSIAFLGVWDTVGSLGVPGINRITSRHAFHDVELAKWVKRGYQALAIDERRKSFEPSIWGPKTRNGEVVSWEPKPGQTVEQVWFAGGHGDVGGGAAYPGLSDLTLEWIVDRAKKAGLAFDNDYFTKHTFGNELAPLHDAKRKLPWRWLPQHKREPGKTWPHTEYVDNIVLNRQANAVPEYLPGKLIAYQKKKDKHYKVMPPPP